MSGLLEKLRAKSIRERRMVAIAVSGILVAIIFSIWVSTFLTRLSGQDSSEDTTERVVEVEEQKASVFESWKRKATLLFGDGGPFSDIDFGLAKPIEYKVEDATTTKKERDLNQLLEEYNASSSRATSTPEAEEIEEEESGL